MIHHIQIFFHTNHKDKYISFCFHWSFRCNKRKILKILFIITLKFDYSKIFDYKYIFLFSAPWSSTTVYDGNKGKRYFLLTRFLYFVLKITISNAGNAYRYTWRYHKLLVISANYIYHILSLCLLINQSDLIDNLDY